jgi:hypothetical protein
MQFVIAERPAAALAMIDPISVHCRRAVSRTKTPGQPIQLVPDSVGQMMHIKEKGIGARPLPHFRGRLGALIGIVSGVLMQDFMVVRHRHCQQPGR